MDSTNENEKVLDKQIFQVLSDANQPLRMSEIMRVLREHGYKLTELPGDGTIRKKLDKSIYRLQERKLVHVDQSAGLYSRTSDDRTVHSQQEQVEIVRKASKKMLAAMQGLKPDEYVTVSGLAEAFKEDKDNIRLLLKMLLKEGKIEKVTVGGTNNGGNSNYWRVTDAHRKSTEPCFDA